MLDINYLRLNVEEVAKKLATKKVNLDIEYFNQLELKRKSLQTSLEELQAKRNNLSKLIGTMKAKGEDITELMQKVVSFAEQLKANEVEFAIVQSELNKWLATLPNLVHESVPIGKDETENQLVRQVGVPRKFDFQVKDHVDLGFALNRQIDFELASKISGSRFVVLKDKIAKLHRALSQFMLNTHIEEHGYMEVNVPFIVTEKSVYNVGQLPKFEADLFKTKRDDDELYLISTSEVPLTNLVADTILKFEELPLKFVAHTPCFRSEAGSYGRDTRGMIRLHQFEKVELVQIVQPDKSFEALEQLTNHSETILKKLGLPYQVVLLCSGDTGFSSAKTYDLEVWLPSQNTYREISSCSNMTNFQSRRMMARYKNALNKNELVHTINGSGLAVGRTLVAILENYQNADGSITIPEILRDFMKCDKIE